MQKIITTIHPKPHVTMVTIVPRMEKFRASLAWSSTNSERSLKISQTTSGAMIPRMMMPAWPSVAQSRSSEGLRGCWGTGAAGGGGGGGISLICSHHFDLERIGRRNSASYAPKCMDTQEHRDDEGCQLGQSTDKPHQRYEEIDKCRNCEGYKEGHT